MSVEIPLLRFIFQIYLLEKSSVSAHSCPISHRVVFLDLESQVTFLRLIMLFVGLKRIRFKFFIADNYDIGSYHMPKSWFNVKLAVRPQDTEEIERWFFARGAIAVTQETPKDFMSLNHRTLIITMGN